MQARARRDEDLDASNLIEKQQTYCTWKTKQGTKEGSLQVVTNN